MLAGRVVEVRNGRALVLVRGRLKEALLDYVKEVEVGDYVVIHYGIVLEKVSREEAEDVAGRCSYAGAEAEEGNVLNIGFTIHRSDG
ncbi:MAG: HypC/HybG/HupF family hydrogenase formation chaperone [Thermococci archaeon]|nr:HypC/HybG/HupF family hydrogenase formation chaperone [Thermococci archaeon]